MMICSIFQLIQRVEKTGRARGRGMILEVLRCGTSCSSYSYNKKVITPNLLLSHVDS